MTGNTFNFNGSVSGQIVNIGSTLTNVTQTVNSMAPGSVDDKAELARLIEELKAELTNVPVDQADQAEAISQLTKDAVEKVEKKQSKPLIDMSLKNLKDAGSWVIETLPKVPQTIDSIVKIIEKIS